MGARVVNQSVTLHLSSEIREEQMLQKIANFIKDVKSEMAKVSWPTKDQLKGQTIIVIVVSLFFAVFIFAVDHLLGKILGLIY